MPTTRDRCFSSLIAKTSPIRESVTSRTKSSGHEHLYAGARWPSCKAIACSRAAWRRPRDPAVSITETELLTVLMSRARSRGRRVSGSVGRGCGGYGLTFLRPSPLPTGPLQFGDAIAPAQHNYCCRNVFCKMICRNPLSDVIRLLICFYFYILVIFSGFHHPEETNN